MAALERAWMMSWGASEDDEAQESGSHATVAEAAIQLVDELLAMRTRCAMAMEFSGHQYRGLEAEGRVEQAMAHAARGGAHAEQWLDLARLSAFPWAAPELWMHGARSSAEDRDLDALAGMTPLPEGEALDLDRVRADYLVGASWRDKLFVR